MINDIFNRQIPNVKFLSSTEDKRLQILLETDRLYIFSYNEERDFEHSVKLYGDSEITKYFDCGQSRSREEVEKLIANIGHTFFDRGEPFGLFSVFKKEDAAFIGHVDFRPTDISGIAEISYIFHKAFHRQGFGTEAIRILIHDFALEVIQKGYMIGNAPLTSIRASVHRENIASIRLLEKVGMSLKGEFGFESPGLWYYMSTRERT